MPTMRFPQVPTPEQIVEYCLALDPKKAMGLTNGGLEDECATPIITKVMVNGKVVHLDLVDGKYAAGYGRVSIHRQKEDGWSIKDQFTRLVLYFIDQGWAFRIFSDAALSGGLPPDDPALIKALCKYKAERFQKVFHQVFLSKYVVKYSDEKKNRFKKYMERRVEEILKGGEGADDVQIADAKNAQKPDEMTGKQYGTRRKKPKFRPGVTVARQYIKSIHTLAMTDRTRISRSQALMVALAEEFKRNSIRLVGLIESFGANNDTDDGADLVAMVLGWVAEAKLKEVCANSLRGLETMLASGLPHSRLPFWCVRVKGDNGRTVAIEVDEDAMVAAKELIRLYLDEDEDGERGFGKVATALHNGGYKTPTPGIPWGWRTVKDILESRTLLGEQTIFGMAWPCLPVVCDELTYAKIQDKMKSRRRVGGRPRLSGDAYLGTGLMKCWCRLNLQHIKPRNQYACPVTCTTVKDKGGRRHVILHAPDVDRFLNDLMLTHPVELIETVTGTNEAESLLEIVNSQRKRLDDIESDLREAESEAAREAAALLAAGGYETANPNYNQMLLALTNGKTLGVRENVEEQRRAVNRAQRDYEAYQQPIGYIDFPAQLERWASMTNLEKNRIYRRLFVTMQVDGVEPDMYVKPVLRTSEATGLPPIRLIVTPRGRAWDRRMPEARSWWSDARKKVKGGRWFGEFRNFEFRDDIPEGPESLEAFREQNDTVQVVPWDDSAGQ